MFSTRGLFMIAGAAGLLAGFSLSQHRQRERQRVASRAKPEPVQTWEGEGGAVPLHTGRTAQQVWPVAIALLVLVPLVVRWRRDLDVLSVDDDVARVLGVQLERTRLGLLVVTALLTAASVSAIGIVGFVGLIAPHLARSLVGSRHSRVVPVAVLLGALLVSVADTLGRSVIAPAQIPAGLLTAMIGAPYFISLLWRTRRSAV